MTSPFSEKFFTKITEEQYSKINILLRENLGFSLDRLAGNLYRECYEMFEVDKLQLSLEIAEKALKTMVNLTSDNAEEFCSECNEKCEYYNEKSLFDCRYIKISKNTLDIIRQIKEKTRYYTASAYESEIRKN